MGEGNALRPFRLLLLFFALTLDRALNVAAKGGDVNMTAHVPYTTILFPGFASSRLRAWADLDCPLSPLDFHPLDYVWLDVKKVVAVPGCWLKCMMLDADNQTDHPDCKSRPDTGLGAVTELDPGYLTGPLSSIWREMISWLVEFGVDPAAVVAVPYDFRLPPRKLQERDLFFSRLKNTFEMAHLQRGRGAIVLAHSLGNNVFRYFIEFLKGELAPRDYQAWLDRHIHAYHAIGAPFLGAAESMKAALTGLTFGLPISEGTARMMSNSFGSSAWMFPFSRFCPMHPTRKCERWRHKGQPATPTAPVLCKPDADADPYAAWPTDVLQFDMGKPQEEAYPAVSEEAAAAAGVVGNLSPGLNYSYSPADIADGTVFRDIALLDPDAGKMLHRLGKYYHDDPILNPLTPWERPPIKNVYCTYGVDLRTEVGYKYEPSGRPYPENWIMTDVMYEGEGGALTSRSGSPVEGRPSARGGDTTVPYHSLSWCKEWLGPTVNVTRAPQGAHNGSDLFVAVNVHKRSDSSVDVEIPPPFPGTRYTTFFEDSHSIPGWRTAVWEMDRVDHRSIVRHAAFLREMFLETIHESHHQAEHPFVPKDTRSPLRDEDCFWDYGRARCAMPEKCEYRYVFGDIHLGQSCRLKNNLPPKTLLQHYL